MRPLGLLLTVVVIFASGCHRFILQHTPLAVDPLGNRLYMASGETVRIIDPRSRRTIATVPLTFSAGSVAVNPSNGQLYVAGQQAVSVIDPSTFDVRAEVPIGADVEVLAVNAAGTRLLVLHSHQDGITSVNADTYRQVQTLPSDAVAFALVPGADLVYVAQYSGETEKELGEATISLLDATNLSVIASISLGRFAPVGLAVHPSGGRLYVIGAIKVSEDNFASRLLTVEAGAHRVISALPLSTLPIDVVVNSSGTRVYVLDNERGTLTAIATSTHTVLAAVGVGKEPYALAVHPSGAEIYVALRDGTIAVVDASSHRVVATIPP